MIGVKSPAHRLLHTSSSVFARRPTGDQDRAERHRHRSDRPPRQPAHRTQRPRTHRLPRHGGARTPDRSNDRAVPHHGCPRQRRMIRLGPGSGIPEPVTVRLGHRDVDHQAHDQPPMGPPRDPRQLQQVRHQVRGRTEHLAGPDTPEQPMPQPPHRRLIRPTRRRCRDLPQQTGHRVRPTRPVPEPPSRHVVHTL